MTTRREFLTGVAAAAAVVVAKPAMALAPVDDLELYCQAVEQAPSIPSWCPDGFLPCDGRSVSKADYPELFRVIGDMFGGDSESFRVPDFGNPLVARPIGEPTFLIEHAIAARSAPDVSKDPFDDKAYCIGALTQFGVPGGPGDWPDAA